jgi:ATP-dependent RNA helicase RhlE
MVSFGSLNLSNALENAITDLGFSSPTPIQQEAFSPILSGKDVVGIAQTGTGKTVAYLLPILRDLKYSDQIHPRVLILVPTRELVIQVVEQTKALSQYQSTRIVGIYGGANINKQKEAVAAGCDILVATPGRLYDLIISTAVGLKQVKKLVIDEVDVMLDLGFRFQLTNIFDHLPDKRQNLMFSATMTEEVETLIHDFFMAPVKIAIAPSGTPLDNINQSAYPARNFYTKVNLLSHLLLDRSIFEKVLVFVDTKKNADRVYEALEEQYGPEMGIIHANKSQNFRFKAVEGFERGKNRILIATDVISRGLDLTDVSHVISFEVPKYPENYIHRIGRTGRAEKEGKSILLYCEYESDAVLDIEMMMDYSIPIHDFPKEVEVATKLLPEERPGKRKNPNRNIKKVERGPAFHEKKEKNKKTNQGGSYLRKKKTYKKPKSRGDKRANQRKKR